MKDKNNDLVEQDRRATTQPVIIKKYANRRLYDTEQSIYVTLGDLGKMVREGRDFIVQDARDGGDITRIILTQIILEEETKSEQGLLPISFLRALISFYGDNLQWLIPSYLDNAMLGFAQHQNYLRKMMRENLGRLMPLGTSFNPQETMRCNIVLFEQMIKTFTPFFATMLPSPNPEIQLSRENTSSSLTDLKAELDRLTARITAIESESEPKKKKKHSHSSD